MGCFHSWNSLYLSMKSTTKERIQNWTIALISTIITLLLVEIGFRVVSYTQEQQVLNSLQQKTAKPENGTRARLGRMVKASESPEIIYDFIPDISVKFKNATVDINTAGFRGDLFTTEKPPATKRVFGLGDSEMFGWGVEQSEYYLSVLSDSLNSNYSSCNWEVINSAVPGYNTIIELETLKQKGLAYQPDYVIVGYVANDIKLPAFLLERQDYFSREKSFLLSYFTEKEIMSVQLSQKVRRQYHHDPNIDNVPKKYRHLIGQSGVENALSELKQLSIEHNFEVIVFQHQRMSGYPKELDFLASTCEQLGFHFLPFDVHWNQIAKREQIDDPESAVRLSDRDPHPNAYGHQVMGEVLYTFLQKELLDSACQN